MEKSENELTKEFQQLEIKKYSCLGSATTRKILRDTFILMSDHVNKKGIQTSLECHYTDLQIPFGQISLLKANMKKTANKEFKWYSLKTLGFALSRVEKFIITQEKIKEDQITYLKLDYIKGKVKKFQRKILEAAGDRARNELEVSGVILKLAQLTISYTEIMETCTKLVDDIENFWQKEIFQEFLDFQSFVKFEKFEVTMKHDWGQKVLEIRELLAYNILTDESIHIIVKDERIFQKVGTNLIRTEWKEVVYKNGGKLGYSNKEIFILFYEKFDILDFPKIKKSPKLMRDQNSTCGF
jgi:hypothetical protein